MGHCLLALIGEKNIYSGFRLYCQNYVPQEWRATLILGKHIYHMLTGLLSIQRVFCQSGRVRKVNESKVRKNSFQKSWIWISLCYLSRDIFNGIFHWFCMGWGFCCGLYLIYLFLLSISYNQREGGVPTCNIFWFWHSWRKNLERLERNHNFHLPMITLYHLQCGGDVPTCATLQFFWFWQ